MWTRKHVSLPDLTLPCMPFLRDHTISGKAMVPAVEMLNLLVLVFDEQGLAPSAPLTMREVAFPRFLPAEELPRCSFAVDLQETGDAVRARLASRIRSASGIERERVHAQVSFLTRSVAVAAPPEESQPVYVLTAERVYRELIPFGRQFCNLRGSLRLARNGAWGTVESPTPPHPSPSRAGCPYLLDSAMHLACLWGQRYAGMVAYPTGFIWRTTAAAIAHGRRRCTVAPRRRDARALTFDLWLTDDEGRVCDAVGELTMAPRAGGAPPPAWIGEGAA